MAREAKAVAKEVAQKPAAQAGKKKLLANLEKISEPMKNKEFWRSTSKDEDESGELRNSRPDTPLSARSSSTAPSSSPSIMSTMSSDFNGMAEKTAGMLSGFFTATKNSQLANKMREKAQPFGPFPGKGRKVPLEKSSLIRHTTSAASAGIASVSVHTPRNVEQKNQNHL